MLAIGLIALGCGKGKNPEPTGDSGLSKAVKGPSKEPMILIPAGWFWMGSPDGQGHINEHPLRRIWLDAYQLDSLEVTFDQYDKFAEVTGRTKPSDEGWGRGKRPAIHITWKDADAYCRWAGKRLPSEAEWERAAWGPGRLINDPAHPELAPRLEASARGAGPYTETPILQGTGTAYFWMTEPKPLDLFAWYMNNSNQTTHPVGEKQPNPYGLYDILGNVWEWCADWYEPDYSSNYQERNPKGPESWEWKVLRGGAWDGEPIIQRPAYRMGFKPEEQSSNIGCRCAKTP